MELDCTLLGCVMAGGPVTDYLHQPWTAAEEKRGWHGESAEVRAKDFLQAVIPKDGVAAEFGVHKGRLTRVILDVTHPTKLHLVDMWYLLGAEWEWGGGDRSTLNGLVGVMEDNLADLTSGRVQLHIGDDLQLIPTFPDEYFDWVYVDTLHSYDHLIAELEALAPKMKPRGIIAGDDYILEWQIPDAVRDFAAQPGWTLIYFDTGDTQWAIQRD